MRPLVTWQDWLAWIGASVGLVLLAWIASRMPSNKDIQRASNQWDYDELVEINKRAGVGLRSALNLLVFVILIYLITRL